MSPDNREQHSGVIPTTWWRGIALLVLAGLAIYLGYTLFSQYLTVAVRIVVLAAVFTFLLQPLVEWVVRVTRAPNPHTMRVVVVLFLYGALALGLYTFGSVVTQTVKDSATQLFSTWSNAYETPPPQLIAIQHWYTNLPQELQSQLSTALQKELTAAPDKYLSNIGPWLHGLAIKGLEWIALFIEMIFVPLIAFYFLTDSRRLREQLLVFLRKEHREMAVNYAIGMNQIFRRYVQSQVILCGIAWAVVTVSLLLMGIPGALLLGVIAGLSRAIPVIGPVIGGVPLLAAVLLDPQWYGAFWWVLIAFTLLHLFESKYLMPRIMGDQLGLHPVIVIISLLVGYELLGLLGMFLAPPTVAMIRFVLAVRRGEGPFAPENQLPLPGMQPTEAPST